MVQVTGLVDQSSLMNTITNIDYCLFFRSGNRVSRHEWHSLPGMKMLLLRLADNGFLPQIAHSWRRYRLHGWDFGNDIRYQDQIVIFRSADQFMNEFDQQDWISQIFRSGVPWKSHGTGNRIKAAVGGAETIVIIFRSRYCRTNRLLWVIRL